MHRLHQLWPQEPANLPGHKALTLRNPVQTDLAGFCYLGGQVSAGAAFAPLRSTGRAALMSGFVRLRFRRKPFGVFLLDFAADFCAELCSDFGAAAGDLAHDAGQEVQ